MKPKPTQPPSSALLLAMAALMLPPAFASSSGQARIRVGTEDGDLRGHDNRVLQAAVDYAAGLGGGTVTIGPGKYLMRNALTLRSRVNIQGTPGKTILIACDGLVSKLAADGDCNERQITLAEPRGFQVGDGVSIQDDRKGGFEVTTATLVEQVDANTFRISAPLYIDYMVSDNATARLVFPVVGGWNVTNVVLDGLTIDGNRAHSQPLNGCRGGGVFLFECADITIRNCNVRDYNGDGISFQVSQRVVVEDCRVENNAGLGLHPGSGSQHPVVRRNLSLNNESDGLFVCWRVKHGLFEENELRDNRGAGISIGHMDSDNLFRKNKILANSRAGVLFHKKPNAREIAACRPWLEAELAVLQPAVLICLGATAAQALLGREFRVSQEHGRFVPSPLAKYVMATVHPSSILRAPDEQARRLAKHQFIEDLKKAAQVCGTCSKV